VYSEVVSTTSAESAEELQGFSKVKPTPDTSATNSSEVYTENMSTTSAEGTGELQSFSKGKPAATMQALNAEPFKLHGVIIDEQVQLRCGLHAVRNLCQDPSITAQQLNEKLELLLLTGGYEREDLINSEGNYEFTVLEVYLRHNEKETQRVFVKRDENMLHFHNTQLRGFLVAMHGHYTAIARIQGETTHTYVYIDSLTTNRVYALSIPQLRILAHTSDAMYAVFDTSEQHPDTRYLHPTAWLQNKQLSQP
jgi:hypothetical protein